MNKGTTLRRCRCGGSARTAVDWEHHTDKGYMHVAVCDKCNARTMPYSTAQEAAAAWNEGKYARESEPLQMTMILDC